MKQQNSQKSMQTMKKLSLRPKYNSDFQPNSKQHSNSLSYSNSTKNFELNSLLHQGEKSLNLYESLKIQTNNIQNNNIQNQNQNDYNEISQNSAFFLNNDNIKFKRVGVNSQKGQRPIFSLTQDPYQNKMDKIPNSFVHQLCNLNFIDQKIQRKQKELQNQESINKNNSSLNNNCQSEFIQTNNILKQINQDPGLDNFKLNSNNIQNQNQSQFKLDELINDLIQFNATQNQLQKYKQKQQQTLLQQKAQDQSQSQIELETNKELNILSSDDEDLLSFTKENDYNNKTQNLDDKDFYDSIQFGQADIANQQIQKHKIESNNQNVQDYNQNGFNIQSIKKISENQDIYYSEVSCKQKNQNFKEAVKYPSIDKQISNIENKYKERFKKISQIRAEDMVYNIKQLLRLQKQREKQIYQQIIQPDEMMEYIKKRNQIQILLENSKNINNLKSIAGFIETEIEQQNDKINKIIDTLLVRFSLNTN